MIRDNKSGIPILRMSTKILLGRQQRAGIPILPLILSISVTKATLLTLQRKPPAAPLYQNEQYSTDRPYLLQSGQRKILFDNQSGFKPLESGINNNTSCPATFPPWIIGKEVSMPNHLFRLPDISFQLAVWRHFPNGLPKLTRAR